MRTKTLATLCLSASLLLCVKTETHAADLYLPVYSQFDPKDTPLHIAAVDPITLANVEQWDFPSAYIGHRAVCRLPGADTNCAFVGWTGASPYDPSADGQYGFVALSDAPVLGLDFGSAATQMYGDFSPFFSMRFDLWKSGTQNVDRFGVVTDSETQLDQSSPIRIRVSRFKINDMIYSNLHFSKDDVLKNRVIMDKVVNPYQSTTITEADFLDADSFDIDWDWFYDDVVTNSLTYLFDFDKTVKVDYLVSLGYSPYACIESLMPSNVVLWTSRHYITRFYGADRVDPVPLPLSFSQGGSPTFEWALDCPEREAYTACRVRLHDGGGAVVRETAVMRMPPNRNAATPRYGRYRWTAPADWLADITNAAAWSVAAYNSKFRNESAVTNTAAITWTPNP